MNTTKVPEKLESNWLDRREWSGGPRKLDEETHHIIHPQRGLVMLLLENGLDPFTLTSVSLVPGRGSVATHWRG